MKTHMKSEMHNLDKHISTLMTIFFADFILGKIRKQALTYLGNYHSTILQNVQ
jgi:hypothetical protein